MLLYFKLTWKIDAMQFDCCSSKHKLIIRKNIYQEWCSVVKGYGKRENIQDE